MSGKTSGSAEVLRELLKLPGLFCFMPYSVSGERLKLSQPRVLFGFLLSLCLLAMGALHTSDRLETPVVGIVHHLTNISLIVTVVTFPTWILLHRRGLRRVLQILSQVDLYLMTNGQPWTVNLNYLEDVLLGLAVLGTLGLYDRTDQLKFASKVGRHLIHWFIFLLILLFKRFTLYVAAGLSLLGQRLADLPKEISFSYNRLDNVLVNYERLSRVIRLWNSIFAPYLLLVSAAIFFIETTNFYTLYMAISQVEVQSMYMISLVDVLLYSYACHVVVTPCMVVGGQAKEFNSLLYRLMVEDKSDDIANNTKMRLHIAMKREIRFTALGFFTLDYELVHSMVAAATTYLVILIQFGIPTEAPPTVTGNALSTNHTTTILTSTNLTSTILPSTNISSTILTSTIFPNFSSTLPTTTA